MIAIIGVLASVVLASLNQARSKARDAKRLAEVRQLQTALDAHYLDTGSYPQNGWICSYQSGWQTSNLATSLSSYIAALPVDPVNDAAGRSSVSADNQNYCYYASGAIYGTIGQWYMITIALENRNTALDASAHGSTDCAGNFRNHGGADGYRITFGGDCVE